MEKPIVSIILPNRNYADFLPDAINSVMAQTLQNWECIIIDDASTDESVTIIKNLITDDNRFKLLTNKTPIGISACRNLGLDIATGEYIAFLDSDDCYTEYALEMLVKLAKNTNVDVAAGTAKIVDAYFHFVKPKKNTEYDIKNYELRNNPTDMLMSKKQKDKWIWIWRRIYKRTLLQNIRFLPEMKTNGDDVCFMLDLKHQTGAFAEADIPVVYHRIHPLSISSANQKFNHSRISVFPSIFKHVHTLLGKYDSKFFCNLYDSLFTYMLDECLNKTAERVDKDDAIFIRNIVSQSCKQIPGKYLSFKKRLLCWWLACQK